MSLRENIHSFIVWLVDVLTAFSRSRPLTTWMVIGMLGVGRVANLLAFFLPLKVILLAGSEGVPRYFRSFVDVDQKLDWIVLLTISAFVCFAVNLVLDRLAFRLSGDAGANIALRASRVPIFRNQGEEAQAYYGRFCAVAAYIIFMGFGIVAGLLLNSLVFLVVLVVILIQYLASSFVLSEGSGGRVVGSVRDFIEKNPRDYARILASLGFLVGFIVILWPYIFGDGKNILIAILSVVILRQTLNVFPLIVGESVNLVRNRHKVDALVFPEIHLERPERRERRELRVVFRKDEREQRILSVLQASGIEADAVDTWWTDSAIRGLTTFTVLAKEPKEPRSEAEQTRRYQLQVYSPQTMSRLDNEQFLFGHIDRASLNAPSVVAHYSEGVFECQLLDFGEGRGVRAADWPACHEAALRMHWSCPPPATLIQAFAESRGLLHKRFHDGMVERLEVAADTHHDEKALALFEEVLPELLNLIKTMPLYVQNLYLDRGNVVRAGDNTVLVMSWGDWSLEPIGSVIPRRVPASRLNSWITELRENRHDIPENFTTSHLRLASAFWELERAINREKFNQGLVQVHRIMANPVVKAGIDVPGSIQSEPSEGVVR